MEGKLVSIILPIYNVEKYLDQCINSVVLQTYKNIEVILVDDGSKDSSGEICDKWEKKDPRIKVIHKQNAGLGMARNTGIDNAYGSYIMFIDSDDYIDKNTVYELYNKVISEKVDAAFCGMKRFSGDKVLGSVVRKYEDTTLRNKQLINKHLMEMTGTLPKEPIDSYLYMSVCTGLYSMSVIKENKIRFHSERELISEDYIFNIDYFTKASGVTFIPGNYYYYRINMSSLSRSINQNRFDANVILYVAVKSRFEKILPGDVYLLRLQRMFLGRVRTCIVGMSNSGNSFQAIKGICNNIVVRDVLSVYPYWQNPLRQRMFNYLLKHRCIALLWMIGRLYSRTARTGV